MMSGLRYEQILERLKVSRQIEVSVLASELGCSQETIRRDLRHLERTGRLQRAHGGAIALPRDELAAVEQRIDQEREAKRIIAGLAAPLVPVGGMVLIGGSSTTLALALRLSNLRATTFVTNMIDIARVLGRGGRHNVFLSGGSLRHSAHTLSGPETLQFLESRVFDLAISGVSGVDLEHGYMGPSDYHAAWGAVVRRQSRQLMVLADASKFGRRDSYRVFKFAEVDVLVTNRQPGVADAKMPWAARTIFPGSGEPGQKAKASSQ